MRATIAGTEVELSYFEVAVATPPGQLSTSADRVGKVRDHLAGREGCKYLFTSAVELREDGSTCVVVGFSDHEALNRRGAAV